ncbi:MHYT domain-containing protein [Streptomyces sp. NPDC050788]|uniref:MHYT domain-containing protein n=1 Tax=Streptomyces sp. NPDC050788 TaxID=3155041 RepID=UPI0034309016
MQGTVDGFRYGAVTPVAAYLTACLGGALGLRCIVRSLLNEQSWKAGWLAMGAAAIGSGIWTMHFIAMLGFQVAETGIRYDKGLTLLSLAVAILVVGIGVFIVGYRGAGKVTLAVAGAITGIGVAAMHYLGMAAVQVNGDIELSTVTVVLSVVIAIVAATAALWAAVSIRGFLPSLGASLVMGVAVSGMHYTAMAGVSVHVHGSGNGAWSGDSPGSLLFPMLVGPAVFLLLAGVVVMFDPLLVLGEGEWNSSGSKSPGGQRTSAAEEVQEPAPQHSNAFLGGPVRPARPRPEQAYPRQDPYGPAAQSSTPQWAPPPTSQDW